MRFSSIISLLILSGSPKILSGQETRISDPNPIAWIAYTGTFKTGEKISIHTEYQFRRVGKISKGQQDLLRTGINFSPNKNIVLTAGYAFIQTYRYGDFPAAFDFPEHRTHQQAVFKSQIGRISVTHRYMQEQRWLGAVSVNGPIRTTEYFYANRTRYRARVDIPLQRKSHLNPKWNLVLQDEIFIGYGKNLNSNIFDQNRVGVLIGYKFKDNFKLEAGYMNQFLQQPRRVNNSPVIQYNHGVLISAVFQFDLNKQKE